MRDRWSFRIWLACALVIAAACTELGVLEAFTPSSALVVAEEPGAYTLEVGDSLRLQFQLVHSNGAVIPWHQHSYASNNPAVASVAKREVGAMAFAHTPGQARITVTARSSVAFVDVTVTAPPPPPDTTPPPPPDTVPPPPPDTTGTCTEDAPVGTYRVPCSIDRTGATDVTDALLAFFASVPDGSTIEFRLQATYRAEGVLLLTGRNNLIFEGNGATILHTTDGASTPCPTGFGCQNWPRTRSHWSARGGSNLTWRNFKLQGAHPAAGIGEAAYVSALEAQHGWDVLGIQGVEISGSSVHDIYGDFVYLGASAGVWAKDVHVHDNHFERNGRQGIGITSAEDVLFEDNFIGQVRRSDIDFEPNSTAGGARRVTFRNNTFGPTRLNFIAAGSSRCGDIRDILIENNTLDGQALKIVMVAPESCRHLNIQVTGNISNTSFGSPIGFLMRFTRITGLTVTGNTNPLQSGRDMKLVGLTDVCEPINISGNSYPGGVAEYGVVTPCGG